MQTSLQGIAKRASSDKKHRFQDLYRLLNEENLKDCWRFIRKDAAYGVDRVSAAEYEANLNENIRELVKKLKRKSYRAKLVRRAYIPKESGKERPLGIPATEDKLLQLAVTRILQAIYEADFLECSYGYRPNIGALDAVEELSVKLQFECYHWVVDADIRGFYDTINHTWMIRMLEERIDDRAFLRLIKKWLKAGILDTDGKIRHPTTGTPQGGIVSPILANVYLHYALDLWFHCVVRKQCRGQASLTRYADDFICTFQYEEDLRCFYADLCQRMGKFGLEISEEKSKLIPFSRYKMEQNGRFDFLGFEYYWDNDRAGRAQVRRRTSRKKLHASLKRFTDWCRRNRSLKLGMLFSSLNAKLRGYYNYYGVSGNGQSLNTFFFWAMKILFKWLNRRSQSRSYNWAGFNMLLHALKVERPRIVGRPKRRFGASPP